MKQLAAEMIYIGLDFLLVMLQELFRLVPFSLHHLLRNRRCLAVGGFKFMVCQGADLLGFFLGNVPRMGKHRRQYTVKCFTYSFAMRNLLFVPAKRTCCSANADP